MGQRRGTETAELVELVLPPRAEAVALARMVVGAVAAAAPDFDDERGADLRLAVSEACTNAIQAQLARGADHGDPRSILVRCELLGTGLRLTVRDQGGGFDPDSLPPHPEATDPARLQVEGGLGIPLIRLLSDEVEFRSTAEGTSVVMTFGPRSDEDLVL